MKKRNLAENEEPVYFLYDLTVYLIGFVLRIPAAFHPKIRQFRNGRKAVWEYLLAFREPSRPLVWMHAASLGEFEQGLPVLEATKEKFPGYQFLVTFFSPSGYEVKKNDLGDIGVCYLPLDTRANARRFLRKAQPAVALFVKYEVWPNFYRELRANGIPLLMISAIFKRQQAYFKWYGGFLRKALREVTHFYLQDEASARLLERIAITDYEVCGDTRFDRVLQILERNNTLPFMERFTKGRTCLVAGSTWQQDERVLLPFLNALDGSGQCAVIAPHKTDAATVQRLLQTLGSKVCLLSAFEETKANDASVLIIDTIGLLTKIYSYADLAYVGGGFATGLHNTLEPAVFGVPVVIGPQYRGFREAEKLVELGGILVVEDAVGMQELGNSLMQASGKRAEIGQINSDFISRNSGATQRIALGVQKLL